MAWSPSTGDPAKPAPPSGDRQQRICSRPGGRAMLAVSAAPRGACPRARKRDAMTRSAVCMLVVALLGAAGCDHTTRPMPPSPDQITVTTNKTHYAPREPILVTVSNIGGSPIFLWWYDCLPSYEKQVS